MNRSKVWKTVTTRRTVVKKLVTTSIVMSKGKIRKNTTSKTVTRAHVAKNGPKTSIKRLAKKAARTKTDHGIADCFETGDKSASNLENGVQDDQTVDIPLDSIVGEDSAVGASYGAFCSESINHSTSLHDALDLGRIFSSKIREMCQHNDDTVEVASLTVDMANPVQQIVSIEPEESMEPDDQTERMDTSEQIVSDAPIEAAPEILDGSESKATELTDAVSSSNAEEPAPINDSQTAKEPPTQLEANQSILESAARPPTPKTPPEPAELVICWRGGIDMVDIAEFQSCAISLAEYSRYIEQALPLNLEVIGRIKPQVRAWNTIAASRFDSNCNNKLFYLGRLGVHRTIDDHQDRVAIWILAPVQGRPQQVHYHVQVLGGA